MFPNLINVFLFLAFLFLLSQSVVNLISELQEQMCKFQEEISNRIQEQRALESLRDSGTREALDQSPDVGLGGSDAEECSCRCRSGGENVGRSSITWWIYFKTPFLPLCSTLKHNHSPISLLDTPNRNYY